MMPTAFDEENCVLDKPPGWDLEECSVLSVFRGVDRAGNPVVISCWKPTREKWDIMHATGRVWLIAHGETMPPVAICGASPFIKETPHAPE